MKVICNMGYTGCSNINDICEHGCICTAVNTFPLPDTLPIHSDPTPQVKEQVKQLIQDAEKLKERYPDLAGDSWNSLSPQEKKNEMDYLNDKKKVMNTEQAIPEQINSGDLFILNGKTHECEGTDGGYVWYDNGEMELAKAEIQDCIKTWYCMDEIPTKIRCDHQCDYCRRGNTKFLCPICGKVELEEAFGTTDLYCPSCKPEGYTDPAFRFTNLWKIPKLPPQEMPDRSPKYVWDEEMSKWVERPNKTIEERLKDRSQAGREERTVTEQIEDAVSAERSSNIEDYRGMLAYKNDEIERLQAELSALKSDTGKEEDQWEQDRKALTSYRNLYRESQAELKALKSSPAMRSEPSEEEIKSAWFDWRKDFLENPDSTLAWQAAIRWYKSKANDK